MFKSFETMTDSSNPRYLFKIIDSEFEAINFIIPDGRNFIATEIDIIIDLYEKKNANVAVNLIKAIKCYSKYDTHNYVMYAIKNESKKFSRYEEEIQKYLILI